MLLLADCIHHLRYKPDTLSIVGKHIFVTLSDFDHCCIKYNITTKEILTIIDIIVIAMVIIMIVSQLNNRANEVVQQVQCSSSSS